MLPSNSSTEALIGEHDIDAKDFQAPQTCLKSPHVGALQSFAMLMLLTKSLAQTQHNAVRFMSFICTLVHVTNTSLHTMFSKLGAVARP